MRKLGILILTLLIAPLIAGVYGIIHDQITYTISPEYFTKFKYEQFGFEPAWFGGHRQTVVAIGFLATWWVGLYIGIVFGLTGLVFPSYRAMFKAVMKAIGITFCIALIAGFIGFLYGRFHLIKTGVDWWFPENLNDKNSFIIVGSIHNFSYLGGFVGLIVGAFLLIYWNAKMRSHMKFMEASD